MQKARSFALIALAILACAPSSVRAYGAEFDLGNYSDVGIYVVEASTNRVLVANNEDRIYEPASLTKLLSILTAMDFLPLDAKITYTEEIKASVRPNSSLARLVVGENLSFMQIIYAMLLPSGNDAARALGVACAREACSEPDLSVNASLELFASLMNAKAEEIGLESSHFTNPDGFPGEGTYSTAKDMAKLGLMAMACQPIAETASLRYAYISTNLANHIWVNTNNLIQPNLDIYNDPQRGGDNIYFSDIATGLKTGNAGDIGGRGLLFTASDGAMSVCGALLHVTKDMQESIWSASSSIIVFAYDAYAVTSFGDGDNSYISIPVANRALMEKQEIRLHAKTQITACLPSEKAGSATAEIVAASDAFEITPNGSLALKKDIEPGEVVLLAIYCIDGDEIGIVEYFSSTPYLKASYKDASLIATVAILFIAASTNVLRRKKSAQY